MLVVPAALAGTAAAQSPAKGPPSLLDGPSPAILRPAGLGLSVARDGTGGLVYLKDISGVAHVFGSAILSGKFQRPQQLDSGLGGPSSQPVVAASGGGLLLIAFVNAGQLYVVDRTSSSVPFSRPLALAAAAANPSIGATLFGKGYLAFTVIGDGGHDVRSAFYDNGQWSLESAPLNASPGDDAGSGAGAGPAIAAAGDGVGTAVWREGGHVYSRRVWGTAPSIIDEQADSPLAGCSEGSVDDPSAGVGGNSSFVGVVFRELVTCGSHQHSRVLMNRLRGSQYDGVTSPDGLSSPGSDGADQPRIAMGEYGDGYVTSSRDGSNPADTNQLFAAALGDNGSQGGVFRVDNLANSAPPYAVPATVGLSSDVIAWQQSPGSAGPPEIRARYSVKGSTLGGEFVASSPGAGPTDAASGLAAGGDSPGDVAMAWVQGSSGATSIFTEQIYQPPGTFGAVQSLRYARSTHPRLTWAAPRGWGPFRYVVSVDGRRVGQTSATSLVVRRKLRNGRHRWLVTAINPAGLASTSRTARVFVDTVPPAASITVTGTRQPGAALRLSVSYRDRPPRGLPASDASGVARVVVNWGDGHVYRIGHSQTHVYRHPGRYKLRVTVIDRAGNRTRRVQLIQI